MKATVRNLSFSPKDGSKGTQLLWSADWSIKNPPIYLKQSWIMGAYFDSYNIKSIVQYGDIQNSLALVSDLWSWEAKWKMAISFEF